MTFPAVFSVTSSVGAGLTSLILSTFIVAFLASRPNVLKISSQAAPLGRRGRVGSSRCAALPTRPANLLALTYEFRSFSRCAHTKATAGAGIDLDLAIGDFNEKKFTRAASCFDLRVLNAG